MFLVSFNIISQKKKENNKLIDNFNYFKKR